MSWGVLADVNGRLLGGMQRKSQMYNITCLPARMGHKMQELLPFVKFGNTFLTRILWLATIAALSIHFVGNLQNMTLKKLLLKISFPTNLSSLLTRSVWVCDALPHQPKCLLFVTKWAKMKVL